MAEDKNNFMEAQIEIDPLKFGKNLLGDDVKEYFTIISLKASITSIPGKTNLPQKYNSQLLESIAENIKLDNKTLDNVKTYYPDNTDPTSQAFCGWDKLNFKLAYDKYKCKDNEILIDYDDQKDELYKALTNQRNAEKILGDWREKSGIKVSNLGGWTLHVSASNKHQDVENELAK